MEIMIPAWPDNKEAHLAKSDLRDLRGVSVALVDDNFDPNFTDEVEIQLRKEYGVDVKRFLKPWGSAPSPAELIEQAAKCRVAIVGIAL